ncbi:MAG: hypothetical protein J7641_03870 [Cyanobacteria bacterium SID2]|nr:hypothetical protein [Cyanobacteria bacterium SID2]
MQLLHLDRDRFDLDFQGYDVRRREARATLAEHAGMQFSYNRLRVSGLRINPNSLDRRTVD